MWGGITLPPNPLQPNTPYKFTTFGTGLYAAYTAGATFSPLIIDYANLNVVSWGSYNYPPVTSGNPDQFVFYASYTVTGSTPASGILTITVTISSPPNTCAPGSWPNQQVTYS
jgi:hypothetical protein